MNGQKPNILPVWAEPIVRFRAGDDREAQEQRMILEMIDRLGDAILTRESEIAHMTASSIIVSKDRRRTLMAFHRIYNSWAWTGGHADGEDDFEAVARREAREETGISGLTRLGGGIASLAKGWMQSLFSARGIVVVPLACLVYLLGLGLYAAKSARKATSK